MATIKKLPRKNIEAYQICFYHRPAFMLLAVPVTSRHTASNALPAAKLLLQHFQKLT